MTIADELEALTDRDGKLRPIKVVQWGSKNRNSKIGKRLEWNDGKAAHQWRLMQARHMIEIYLFQRPAEPQYISLRIDRNEPGGGYRRISDIMQSKSLIQYMMEDALKDLNHAKERYHKLEALAGVWSAVAKATARHKTSKGGSRKATTARKPGRKGQARKSA